MTGEVSTLRIPAARVLVEELCTKPDGTLCVHFMGLYRLVALDPPECGSRDYSQDYSQAATLCNLDGSHGGFLTSCLISAMAAGLLLLPDASGTEGIQTGDTQPPFSSSYTWVGYRKSVLGGSLASLTPNGHLPHNRIQAADITWGSI